MAVGAVQNTQGHTPIVGFPKNAQLPKRNATQAADNPLHNNNRNNQVAGERNHRVEPGQENQAAQNNHVRERHNAALRERNETRQEEVQETRLEEARETAEGAENAARTQNKRRLEIIQKENPAGQATPPEQGREDKRGQVVNLLA